jgi:hypothetical protein
MRITRFSSRRMRRNNRQSQLEGYVRGHRRVCRRHGRWFSHRSADPRLAGGRRPASLPAISCSRSMAKKSQAARVGSDLADSRACRHDGCAYSVAPGRGRAVDIAVTRGKIDVESVTWARIPDTNYVYLQISQFAADTGDELQKALEAINAEAETARPSRGSCSTCATTRAAICRRRCASTCSSWSRQGYPARTRRL